MSTGVGSRPYNPDWLSDDALLASYIARQSDFHFLRDELARVPLEGSVQHHLLVGQRGSGKTTLLKRLAVAIRRDADLNDHLIALSFPEELYQVKNIADFWRAACEALGDELERLGQPKQARCLFDELDRGNTASSNADSSATEPAALTRLLATCHTLQRRPVMLLDNLDLVITRIEQGARSKHKGPGSNVYWSLREALSTTTSPVVIGGSVSLSEPFTQHDKAFYDFFLPKRLGRLPLAEVREVLQRLAEQQGQTEVQARLAQSPARIETLYELTGGNPRAIRLIFDLLQQGASGRAVDDFERLMDLTTPYYKARFEDLPEQAQIVMHALAVRRPGHADGTGSHLRFGHTAAEIASHAGLPTNTVSAQMDVLAREGLVEKSSGPGRTQYRIAEQLFRLWLQMRGSRRVRQNVIGLAEFLEAWFSGEELMAQLHTGSGRSGALLSFAVAETSGIGGLRHGLIAHGADLMMQHSQARGEEFDEALPAADLPGDLAQLVALRQRLQRCSGAGLTPAQCDALLGSLTLRPEQKAAGVEALCRPASSAAEMARLLPLLASERQKLLRFGMLEADLPLLYELRAKGQLPLPFLKPADVEAMCAAKPGLALRPLVWRLMGMREWVYVEDDVVAESWLQWGERHAAESTSTEWANVAGTLRKSGRHTEAEQALSRGFQCGDSARAWYERAELLAIDPKSHAAAEAVFRKSIQHDASDPLPWAGLGDLLRVQPSRPHEAEAAYRRAIDLDPDFAWPWTGLGKLIMRQPNRAAEAEAAFRKATKLDAAALSPRLWLGVLLGGFQNRPDEAEVVFRMATEVHPDDWGSWTLLGILLDEKLSRPAEAVAAYHRALELNPQDDIARGWFAQLLLKQRQFDEARHNFERALERDAKDGSLWREELQKAIAGQLAQRTHKALQSAGVPAARQALEEGLAQADNLPALLAAEAFADELLAPALANREQAKELLAMLRDLGLDRHARPLLLAFEAAIQQQPEALSDLEPEVRRAALRIYGQLTAKRLPI